MSNVHRISDINSSMSDEEIRNIAFEQLRNSNESYVTEICSVCGDYSIHPEGDTNTATIYRKCEEHTCI